jgi:hypothetical protein
MSKTEKVLIDSKFDINKYSNNMHSQQEYIDKKISRAEKKITSLSSKEKIINDIITRTSLLYEKAIEESNYKLIGIHQSNLLKQVEALGQIQEMLSKGEDLIYKYIKMNTDLDKEQANIFIKINNIDKDNDLDDNNLMKEFHQIVHQFTNDKTIDGKEINDMNMSITDKLKLKGY